MQNPLSLLKFSSFNRLPVILQTEVAECGLTCLAMIATYFGHEIDLTTLRRRYPVSLRGTTLHQIIQTAEKMNYACRPLRLELEEMDQLQTPCILHWDMNHFVVLKKVTKSGIVIHDPAQGERSYHFNEVSKHFTGVALELTPTTEFKIKKEVQKVPFYAFWHKIIGLKSSMLQVFLLSVVLQAFSLISPFYNQLVVDQAIVSHDMGFLKILAIGFLLVMLIQLFVTGLRSLLVLSLGSMLSIQMATNLFRHLIRLPLPFFEKRHIGDIVSRFGSLGQIEKLLTTSLVQAIVDGMMAISTLIMLFIYSSMLAMVVITAVTLYGLIRFAWYRPLKQLTEENMVASSKESSNFIETIRAIQSIKIYGKEADRGVLWQNRYADTINTGIRQAKLSIIYSTINSLLFGVENIVVIYLCAKMITSGMSGAGFTIGMMFAFISYKQQFTSKAIALIENVIELKMLGLHLERLGDIVLEKPEVEAYTFQSNAKNITGKIELKDICFNYAESEPAVVNKVSFTIQPGEIVALVGASGCGKTTLMKVMMGLFKPTAGEVLIDGIPLDKLGISHFRSQVAAVMQDDQLLSGSISDNICFFDPQVDMEKVEISAKMAMIHQDIVNMPMGYNSLIGEIGASLSGGQKQRVLLARALYRSPKILFLDEATSHLDVALEHGVNQSIQHLNMTRVIIAHRPDTIRSAQRVIVFTPEGVVEQAVIGTSPASATVSSSTSMSTNISTSSSGYASQTYNVSSSTSTNKEPEEA
jgi:ATP-binding cassette subfamily B protein RaxB